NILAAYGTKSVAEVRGLGRTLPLSGVLWVVGFLAITGSPPFGPFLSELTILKSALDQGRGIVAAGYLALLAVIFIGMANLVLPRARGGAAGPGGPRGGRGALWPTVPPPALGGLVFVLGVYVPPQFGAVLHVGARFRGGK